MTQDDKGATEKLRVMIVDDHALFRRGLEMVLQDEDDLMLVGEAPTARRPSRRRRS